MKLMGEKYEIPTIFDRAFVVKVTGSDGNPHRGSQCCHIDKQWSKVVMKVVIVTRNTHYCHKVT